LLFLSTIARELHNLLKFNRWNFIER
jgi:hypothetical protein